ncbi:phosphate transport regulator [Ideonella azotifigens]|uniref:Phosphate transport regulator n=1 Tax=Ideonella azotifigens TaxID=513160 RepID=A0ABP3VR86_9BURK|nr:phosphate transport regulator [Ideonella azotifigens]MCD2344218.1 phosphate transport regulator [Ideonella azotifigens]
MQKTQALTALGQQRLMLPAWVKAALAANDRLKVYLTVLQTAAAHASHPNRDLPDLTKEIAATTLEAGWLMGVIAVATRVDDSLALPELPRLIKGLEDDLTTMARPVLESVPAGEQTHVRVEHWLAWLRDLPADRLADAQVDALTRGLRGEQDSLHLLVMDLHKQINKLSAELASEVIAGANAWELQPGDRPRVAAFMRGLNRTSELKFDHPGLDTVATRDGERLLIQNDIGTNDAHVLVLQVTGCVITLTYSDLHPARFEFFQSMLAPLGAAWSERVSRTDAELNQGLAYTVGTASFDCADDAAVEAALEGIGSRIVFLIDWNRARKRLRAFVDKQAAITVLADAARLDVGHRAWLQVGGEGLIFAAMQAVGEGAFRIGDRLDEVIGAADAHSFLVAVMRLACDALHRGQPVALVADETRMLLARHVRQRSSEFDLLAEHAAYCETLAQAIGDALAHGAERSAKAAAELSARAKTWERRADELVMQAREKAERQPRWRPVALLVAQSDDVADALEEAAFLISLIADGHLKGWNDEVRKVLGRLATSVRQATQDQVKALAIARTLGAGSEAADNDAFLRATWRVVQAEQACDALLRDARREMLAAIQDAPSLMLANDLACTLELASDRLLVAAYALRDLVFGTAGVRE